ncbi:MAG TPA: PGF-pre-PGF domain-containing protein [Candidatus Nanoarchaeia archaeon]|nr:PGF-pre-PGF domain-containing protein [Candidatus Nanoarchaeia archaeon]
MTAGSNFKNREQKIFILLLLNLFLLSFILPQASAQFTAYSQNSQINLCAGSIFQHNITITNTGTKISSYTIYSESSELAIYPDFMILAPGESAQTVFFASRNSPGNSEVSIYVSDNSGTQEISLAINAFDCFGIQIEAYPEKNLLCGEDYYLNFNVKNTGIFSQNISLSVNEFTITDSSPNYADKLLNPQESRNETLRINTSCEGRNETNVEINAFNLQKPEFSTVKKISIPLGTEEEAYRIKSVTSGINTNYNLQMKKIILRNSGFKPANYSLSLEAPNWVYINMTNVELNAGQTKNIALFTNADFSVIEGDYALNLNIRQSEIQYGEKIILSINPTFTQRIKIISIRYIVPYLLFIVLGILVVVFFIILAVILRIAGKKKKEKLRKQMLEGGFEEKAEFTGSKFTKFWKRIGAYRRTVFLIGDEEEIPVAKIEILTSNDVKNAELKLEKIGSTYTPDSKAYKHFRIDKRNLNDSDISSIIINFRVALSWLKENGIREKNICLARYRKRWEYFDAEFKGRDDEYVYYASEINGFSYFAIIEKTPEINELLSYEKDDSEEHEEQENMKQEKKEKSEKSEKSVQEKNKRKENIVLSWIVILLVILSVLVFVYSKYYFNNQTADGRNQTALEGANKTISGAQEPAEPETGETENIDEDIDENIENESIYVDDSEFNLLNNQEEIDSVLAFIEGNNITDSFNYQIISKNQKLTMNLNYIFEDPDNDILDFSFSPSENLNITITDYDVLVIIPKKDWYGVEKIEIFADDGGTVISSGEINIIVLNKDISKKKMKDYIGQYKAFILIGIAIIIVLVISAIIISARGGRKKRMQIKQS